MELRPRLEMINMLDLELEAFLLIFSVFYLLDFKNFDEGQTNIWNPVSLLDASEASSPHFIFFMNNEWNKISKLFVFFSGTFFQPFINGINTFFNPSQFRNPLLSFRDNQQQQRQPQQQQFNTNFQSQPQPSQSSQQFGATQQTFNFQDFRNNPTFQQDFSLTRFPQVS